MNYIHPRSSNALGISFTLILVFSFNNKLDKISDKYSFIFVKAMFLSCPTLYKSESEKNSLDLRAL